jgi:exonuclease III
LNISTKNKKTLNKILALTRTGNDIILLSDIRLNNLVQVGAVNDLVKKLEFNGYGIIQNSPFSSRGVAILVKNSLNIEILETKSDRIGNILGIKTRSLGAGNLGLLSIYGPNTNNREFYADLNRIMTELECDNYILGGDWNSTWDSSPPEENIDVFFMQNIPSKERSECVLQLARNFRLTDPYRFLYPNSRDYTYVPNAVNNKNRSRIDFFLVSEQIIPEILDASITTGRLTTLFDHKLTYLETGMKRIPVDRTKICNNILDDDIVKTVIELTVKEFYLNNADPDSVPRYTVNILRFEIGRIMTKLKESTDTEMALLRTGNIPEPEQNRIANLISDALDIAETLPDLAFFENLPSNVEPDVFFEGLVLSVKNEVLSKQASLYKLKNFRKMVLRENIARLKKNVNENRDEIYRQEKILDNHIESELKLELEKYRKFERLNQEKITPHFMNLVKKDSLHNTTLDSICDNNGAVFNTGTDREQYITEFYSDLYKKNEAEPETINIHDFMGDTIDHPAVTGAKLTENEKADLDSDLNLIEFDNAVNEMKPGSAPGIDGISNKFIKKFWRLFRTPLFKYAVYCLDRGSLTDSFRVAKIRLIPKKGDPKKISNWRPISLLNCFYKLISRVITNRIRKVSDKITQVGQKGYSKTKVCQEVTLELIDKIFQLKRAGKTGCILSLDIKKAFDSISHRFLFEALKFFNFGETIIKWIKTICTNRLACIIMSNGKLGPNFNLERGNAQGDVISPFLFNICYQILLLKVECALQIKTIDLPDEIVQEESLVGVVSSVSHRSKKVFAFADDCNIITVLEKNNLDDLKQILTDFGNISGLVCNLEKTNIMAVGLLPEHPDPEIENISFSFVDELSVLGFILTNADDILIRNTETLNQKLLSELRKWARFNLSLPGRINICKTMFYSQLNYIGSLLPVSDQLCDGLEDIIYRYVNGNLRIAKNRVFLPVKLGGLGLFKVKEFLFGQKCSWIRRCACVDQVWKAGIISTGNGNIFKITEKNIDENMAPIRHGIALAFRTFVTHFTQKNNNFQNAYLLDNEALTIGIRSRFCLRETDLVRETEASREFLKNIKISDLILDGQMINKHTFQRNTGIELSREVWEKLDKIRRAATTKYGKDPYRVKDSLLKFFQRWKRGSKIVRNILIEETKDYIPHNMVKFAENTETIIGCELAMHINKSWNNTHLSNELRTFIFKLNNNTLPVNTILSHFVRGVNRNCTFCDLNLVPVEEDENILHLFFDCPTSETLREKFFKWITSDNNFSVTRREFFGIFRNHNNYVNVVLETAKYVFLKFVWDCKIRKCLPSFSFLKDNTAYEFLTMRGVSNKFAVNYNNCGFNLDNIFNDRFRF